MASIAAQSVCRLPNAQAEFTMRAGELRTFLQELQNEVQGHPADAAFHLQIQRCGEAPAAGQPAPINKGDDVTVTIHPHPGP